MVSVRTSIFERPRRLPGQRRADLYTLICEEPVMRRSGVQIPKAAPPKLLVTGTFVIIAIVLICGNCVFGSQTGSSQMRV